MLMDCKQEMVSSNSEAAMMYNIDFLTFESVQNNVAGLGPLVVKVTIRMQKI